METLVSNSGKTFNILSREGKSCIIQFVETGYVRKANIDNLRTGKVKDLYAVSVYGKGYYGEFPKTPYWKQAKQLWQNMLKRCYCSADVRGYFGKVAVDPRWLCFANFLSDLPTLKNFENWLSGQTNNATKYNLDKDLIVEGCTVYSKETCQFITEYENKAAGARNGKPYTRKLRLSKD